MRWAQAALRWAVERQSHLPSDHLPRLRTTKNTAYPWRQAVFFLSYAAPDQQRSVVDTLAQQLAETSADTQTRTASAVAGLRLVLRGGTFDNQGKGPGGERRFLGWACGQHWMLPE